MPRTYPVALGTTIELLLANRGADPYPVGQEQFYCGYPLIVLLSSPTGWRTSKCPKPAYKGWLCWRHMRKKLEEDDAQGQRTPHPGPPHGGGRSSSHPGHPTGEGDAHIASGLRQRDEQAHGAVHGLYTANKRIYDKLKRYAREMRQDPTPAEGLLWRALRGEKAGAYFRRQHVLGQFIVDFVCLDRRLVIEVDGDIHDHQ